MKIPYIKNLAKIPWLIGYHAFLFTLIFIVINIFIGFAVYCNYIFLAKIADPKNSSELIEFQKSVYDEVLLEWESRNLIFSQDFQGGHPDPFQ